ncbi:MAG: hypothetical protein L0191_04520 [Acidobacteria bacterium]|nr:hypothetical protein [Acidobacteriota bacterium]MCI0568480.1 hypothetical protein [Acidobacteriota bacterium]
MVFSLRRWCRIALAALVLANAACAGQAPTAPAGSPSLSPLHSLDKAGSAEFRRAFDDGKDRTRFIVALSPT